jgi:uncharacterized protein
MIAILSPAKTLDFEKPIPDVAATRPHFPDDAETLSKAAAKLSAKKLGQLMHISPKLAKLNAERFRGFTQASERPALYAFMGDVYLGFAARGLAEEAIGFAQGHVRILSGLYGLLRPLDSIRPYRLEMGTRWAPGRKKDLYGYWGDRLGKALADALVAEGSGVIVNLASQEYWAAIAQAPPKGARILTIDFRDKGPDGPRFISFNAKRARGMMARFICAKRIDDPEGLKDFDMEGYRFDPTGSEGDRWQFVRG